MLLRHPFFRRYGVILPSSLTEGRSITLGFLSLPTCVGLRYGRKQISLEAFLGGLVPVDFRALAGTRCSRHALALGLFLESTLRRTHPACPFAGPSLLTASPLHSNDLFRCRNLIPACHRLRLFRPRLRTRLTLRRLTLLRNPQAFGVSGSHRHHATHSGILTSSRSTSPLGLASPLQNAPLPSQDTLGIHGFGTML